MKRPVAGGDVELLEVEVLPQGGRAFCPEGNVRIALNPQGTLRYGWRVFDHAIFSDQLRQRSQFTGIDSFLRAARPNAVKGEATLGLSSRAAV
jgi:hypothetical protein